MIKIKTFCTFKKVYYCFVKLELSNSCNTPRAEDRDGREEGVSLSREGAVDEL